MHWQCPWIHRTPIQPCMVFFAHSFHFIFTCETPSQWSLPVFHMRKVTRAKHALLTLWVIVGSASKRFAMVAKIAWEINFLHEAVHEKNQRDVEGRAHCFGVDLVVVLDRLRVLRRSRRRRPRSHLHAGGSLVKIKLKLKSNCFFYFFDFR